MPTLSFLAADVVALPPAEPVLVEPLEPLLDEPQALSARAAVAASASTLVTRRKGVSFAVLGPARGRPGGDGTPARAWMRQRVILQPVESGLARRCAKT